MVELTTKACLLHVVEKSHQALGFTEPYHLFKSREQVFWLGVPTSCWENYKPPRAPT